MECLRLRYLLFLLTLLLVCSFKVPPASSQPALPLEGKGAMAGNSGAFAYTIPIEVPPGRRGLAPRLALTYNSSGDNGFLGVGWDLPIGEVMRSTKRGVNYACNPSTSPDPCFVFMLGGAASELIPRTDWCADCYGAKVEGAFIRFRLVSGASWEATDKSGTKYLLGSAAGSRQDGPPGVFKWCLDQVIDPNGNSMTLTYIKDQGQVYLDRIDYTYPGPTNYVKFYYESRTDAPVMYTSNLGVMTVEVHTE